MHIHLVEAGFLEEMSGWLSDLERRELGPLDLRTAALDILLGFDFEGVSSVRKKQAQAKADRSNRIDTDIYEGVNSDQLKSCTLGGAVNFVRTAPQETRDNRLKATTMLERMSRCFHEANDEDEEGNIGGGAKWPLMNDRSIASPFTTVKSQTEAFMGACVRIDPEDPTSYMKQPPSRYPRSFISGMDSSIGRSKRNRDDEM